jgi:hypothetical protein
MDCAAVNKAQDRRLGTFYLPDVGVMFTVVLGKR